MLVILDVLLVTAAVLLLHPHGTESINFNTNSHSTESFPRKTFTEQSSLKLGRKYQKHNLSQFSPLLSHTGSPPEPIISLELKPGVRVSFRWSTIILCLCFKTFSIASVALIMKHPMKYFTSLSLYCQKNSSSSVGSKTVDVSQGDATKNTLSLSFQTHTQSSCNPSSLIPSSNNMLLCYFSSVNHLCRRRLSGLLLLCWFSDIVLWFSCLQRG